MLPFHGVALLTVGYPQEREQVFERSTVMDWTGPDWYGYYDRRFENEFRVEDGV